MIQDKVTQIVSSLSSARGEKLFTTLVPTLLEAIEAEHLFIATIDNEKTTATSVIYASQGHILDNFSYELKNTPCADVSENNICLFNGNVQSLYPEDYLLVAMEVNSYVGAPLVDSDGKVHGIIVALYSGQIENSEEVSSLFSIFSGLISGELERTRNKIQLNLNESIINSLDESVIVTNAHKQIIYANPAFLKLSGYTLEEVMGKDPGDLLRSGKHDRSFYARMWQSISETGSWSGEITNNNKDGKALSHWLKIKKITDIGGSKINYIGIYLNRDEFKDATFNN